MPGKPTTLLHEKLVPIAEEMPPEKSSDRVRLIYSILRALTLLAAKSEDKAEAALKEVQERNPELYKRVKKYWSQLTLEQRRFYIGPRPHYTSEGLLAIYHPIKDNPLLMPVIKGEKPEDIHPVTLRPRPKLELSKDQGGIV